MKCGANIRDKAAILRNGLRFNVARIAGSEEISVACASFGKYGIVAFFWRFAPDETACIRFACRFKSRHIQAGLRRFIAECIDRFDAFCVVGALTLSNAFVGFIGFDRRLSGFAFAILAGGIFVADVVTPRTVVLACHGDG